MSTTLRTITMSKSFFYISAQGARAIAGASYFYAKVSELTLETGAKLKYSAQAGWYVQSLHYSREDIEPYRKYERP